MMLNYESKNIFGTNKKIFVKDLNDLERIDIIKRGH